MDALTRTLIRIYGEPWIALPPQLKAALPRHKSDAERLTRWETLSPSERTCLIPFLLVWLQDINWPIATQVQALLVPLGARLIPYLEGILAGPDEVWTYWIIESLLPALPRDTLAPLRPELERLASTPSTEEVDLVAADALGLL